MTDTKDTIPEASETTTKVIDEQLEKVKGMILAEAKNLAAKESREEVGLEDIASAYLKLVQGTRLYEDKAPRFGVLPLLINRVFSSISGLTIVSAILAIVFGYLGYRSPANQSGLYDIAKIFAGAVVGSTGATAASNIRRDG
jgi:hypothetical protein